MHPTKISFVSGVIKNGEKILDGVFEESQAKSGSQCLETLVEF